MPNFDNLVNDNQKNIGGNNVDTVLHETYTDDEIRDVNNISVTIPDARTPIVIFFGAPASGKTLALLRMIRFLEQHNHQVIPEAVFRPQTDRHYTKMCAGLKDMAYSKYAPGGTDIISFMLVKVIDQLNNRTVCQILEAPGEHYFDGSADLSFPRYINAIRVAPNRKVWVFFVEQNWGSESERNLYAQKICSMQRLISPNDRIVFLFNKVDKREFSHQCKRNGQPNKQAFFEAIEGQYPGIFTRYQNTGIAKIMYGPYNFKCVCFSSGVFNLTNDGREVWTPEKDWYCQELWNAIR